MTNSEHDKFSIGRPGLMRRKAVTVSQEQWVKLEHLNQSGTLPLVIQPSVEGINLITWVAKNWQFVETHLLKSGGILLRNFNLSSADDLEEFIKATSSELLEYRERSSPRSQISGKIYTSTDYVAEQSIFLHNEQSYNYNLPLRIFFLCIVAAQQGGETPVADSRKVLLRIDPRIRERFIQKKYMLIRNFGDGLGLSWPIVFQTSDKAEVEKYCRDYHISYEWRDGNRLRTKQIRDVIAKHPQTGELVWFNHLTFFHVSTLEPLVREALLADAREEDLPNNTYYGDGSPIEPSILDELREAYIQEMVSFRWQEGDLLMLDNLLVAHGRAPYVGPRKIVVGMSNLLSWKDLQI